MFFKHQPSFRAALRAGPTAYRCAVHGTVSGFQGFALRRFAATPAGYAVGRRLAFHTSLLARRPSPGLSAVRLSRGFSVSHRRYRLGDWLKIGDFQCLPVVHEAQRTPASDQ